MFDSSVCPMHEGLELTAALRAAWGFLHIDPCKKVRIPIPYVSSVWHHFISLVSIGRSKILKQCLFGNSLDNVNAMFDSWAL